MALPAKRRNDHVWTSVHAVQFLHQRWHLLLYPQTLHGWHHSPFAWFQRLDPKLEMYLVHLWLKRNRNAKMFDDLLFIRKRD